MNQITTITFFRFDKLKAKAWAFKQMGIAHRDLSGIRGQSFYKLMGSGRWGFNPFPDWSVYALLQVWKTEADAWLFQYDSSFMQNYFLKASEIWSLFLKNMSSKGEWSGINPFRKSASLEEKNPKIVVITRATIKWNKLIPFWSYTPKVQKRLNEMPGLVYTKGIGEVPVRQMATFSLWENEDAMKNFAYDDKSHQGAIDLTRHLDWYDEELFARFQPYASTGTWSGKLMVPELNFVLADKKFHDG